VGEDRLKLGWKGEIVGAYSQIEAPTAAEVEAFVAASGEDSFHIFVGMRHLRCVTEGISACIRHGRRFAIMHETRVSEGLAGLARYVQSWLTEGRIRRHGIVLAIGAHGPKWFLRTGYRPKQIFPFAYFIASHAPVAAAPRGQGGPVRIGYVGRLEDAKGLPEVLEMAALVQGPFELLIVGGGTWAPACEELASRDSRVRYLGVLPVEQVQQFMSTLDVLVQPSRTVDDGWGVVVSEALLNGVAVVASARVGASACLADPVRGRIVPPRRPQALADAIGDMAAGGAFSQEFRNLRQQWALSHLTGDVGADYLLQIIGSLHSNVKRPKSFLL